MPLTARWTPADDSPLIFSKRLRTGDYTRWLDDDGRTPSMQVMCVLLLLLLGLARYPMRWIARWVHGMRSERAAQDLLVLEAERQAQVRAQQQEALPLQQPPGGVRYCRYCDVAVLDEHVEAHLSGKRHAKHAQYASSEASCWVWRAEPATAAPPTPEADAALDPGPLQRPTGGGDGGKGKWQTSGGAGKLRSRRP